MRFRDEDEIDEWYDTEKEKLVERYEDAIRSKEDRDKAEEIFHQEMRRLYSKYYYLKDLLKKKQQRRELIKKKIRDIKGVLAFWRKNE